MKYQDQLQYLLLHLIQQEQQVTTSATFQINNYKLYVAVVTVSLRDKITFFENIKPGFTGKISRDKHRSEITTQPKNNKFDYMIDPTFWNISKLQSFAILVICLFFHAKTIAMILQQILSTSFTCHWCITKILKIAMG